MSLPIKVMLLAGAEHKVFGMPVHKRNAVAVQRGGATVVSGDAAKDDVLRVPSHIVVESKLIEAVSSYQPPCQIAAPNGAALSWGNPDSSAVTHQLQEDLIFDVSTRAQRNVAERVMLRRTEKPTDGVVSLRFNRPQSRFFSLRFLRLGLGPNFASAISLLVGVVCGLVAAVPGYWGVLGAGVLFQFASMFDGVDGEMARATFRQSKLGALIDTLADNLTYLATLIGFSIGWYAQGLGSADIAILVVASAAIVITLLQVYVFVKRFAPDASMVFFDSCVRDAAAATDRRGLKMVGAFFVGLRRDVLSFVFMLVSLAGSRALIMVLVLFGAIVANAALWVYRSEVFAQARLRHGS